VIRFEDVRIRRGGFTLRADWEVGPGLTAVMGPSGSGKSTLLAALAGFVPAEGRILVEGRDISRLDPAARPVTLLFQEHNLFEHLTAFRNVALGLRVSGRLTAAERARAETAMAAAGLEGLGDRMPADLSGGQRGRVALARALLRDRPVLALDEPFAALGPALRRDMLGLVREAGRTALLVTHHPDDARGADGLVFVDGGVAAAPVPSGALSAPTGALRAYLGG